MKYSVRYAHLSVEPKLKQGDTVFSGEIIGIMGSSGQSKHNHLHIDCVEGLVSKIIHLSEIGYDKKYKPNIRQLNHFIDGEIFKIKPVITTYYYDPGYKILFSKDHPAYDIVPEDRHDSFDHFSIHWNRSVPGTVLTTGYDQIGYGHYVIIGFEI